MSRLDQRNHQKGATPSLKAEGYYGLDRKVQRHLTNIYNWLKLDFPNVLERTENISVEYWGYLREWEKFAFIKGIIRICELP